MRGLCTDAMKHEAYEVSNAIHPLLAAGKISSCSCPRLTKTVSHYPKCPFSLAPRPSHSRQPLLRLTRGIMVARPAGTGNLWLQS